MEYSPKNNPTITVGFRPFQSVDLSLTGCSSAEPASVSVQHSKNSNQLVYLQTVKIPGHFQLKELEHENSRLKRIVANLTLENDAIKELLKKF
jgi:hypothetical protein